MLFLRRTAILKKELEYERTEGPSLRLLAGLSQQSPIFDVELPATNQVHSHTNQFVRIVTKREGNGNLRILYVAVLVLAYRQGCQSEGQLPVRLKECIYTGPLVLPDEPSAMSSCLVFSSQETTKKVIAELLQTVLYGKESIWSIINRTQCLDELMMVVLRNLLTRQHPHASLLNDSMDIPDTFLFHTICRLLNIEILQTANLEWHLSQQLVIRSIGNNKFELTNEIGSRSQQHSMGDTSIRMLQSQLIESPKANYQDQNQPPPRRFSAIFDPRTAISEESNSVQSDNELSDVIERYNIGRNSSFSQLSGSIDYDLSENFDFSNVRRQPSIDAFHFENPMEDSIKEGFRKEKVVTGSNEDTFPRRGTDSTEKPFNIFDGMTGEQVIKIMSPRHVKSLNERKKQSMISMLGSGKLESSRILLAEKTCKSNCQEKPPSPTVVTKQEPPLREVPVSSLRNCPESEINKPVWRTSTDWTKTIQQSGLESSGLRLSCDAYHNMSPKRHPSSSYTQLTPNKTKYLSTLPVTFVYQSKNHTSPANPRKIFGQTGLRDRTRRIQFSNTPIKPATQLIRRVEGKPTWRSRQTIRLIPQVYNPNR